MIQDPPHSTIPNDARDKSVSKPAQTLSLWQLLSKATILALGIFLVFVVISLLIIGVFAYQKYTTFLRAANLTHAEVLQLYSDSNNTQPSAQSGKTIVLILGVDTVDNKQAPPLTDTMLLVSIDSEANQFTSLPLPRDLWSEAYQTKFNALYHYGFERYPARPEQFVEEVITEVTTVPIDYTVVISLDSVAEIIDLAGGLEIDIPTGFVDERFPRSDITLESATSEAEIYKTVTFSAGQTVLSGERTLEYIRSRNSEGDTGTDEDRGRRQQLVVSSLVSQLSDPKLYLDRPELLAQLYLWYDSRLDQQLPITHAGALALQLLAERTTPQFSQQQLPIYPDSEHGIIENPPLSTQYQGQWVYQIRDSADFRQYVQETLLK
ncbi:MAG: LCP family protein [Patescibacteria group bacterium]